MGHVLNKCFIYHVYELGSVSIAMPITSILHLQSLPNLFVFCHAVCSIGVCVFCVKLSFSSQVIGGITSILYNYPW